jgi:hypothetical protein
MAVKELSEQARSFARNCLLCVLCVCVVNWSSLRAATPSEELLRLVPDSVGFCVVVQDLRGHAAALQNSPFLQQLSRSSLAVTIRKSEDVKKLDAIEAKMKDKLGLDWTRLRDDVLGDALVLAYRPGPPGKPEQEQGIMLLRARNATVLVELIERVNKVQKEEGELKDLQERRHNDATYYRRLEYDKRGKRDKPPSYYYVHGAVLAVSSQEDMIRQVIDYDRKPSSDRRDAGPTGEAERRLRELDAGRALLATWINPRAFDAEMDAKVARAPAERVAAVKHFVRYWKALDSVVLSLSLAKRDVSLSLGVRARVEELPPAARRLFREAATPSDTWRRFPESALLAVGGRLDGAALLEVIGGFLTPEARRTMNAVLNRQSAALLGEEDFARVVLPNVGPDWGLCLSAPSADAKNWLPQTVFALRIEGGRDKTNLHRQLLGAIDAAARLFLVGHNMQHPQQPMALKTGNVGGREVRYLAGERGLPAGLQPAFGMVSGYLVLSSSLDGMTRFAQAVPASPPSGNSPTPLLRISCKDWRSYLNERREPIVAFLADKNKISREEATRKLDGLLAGLQFVERVELRQRVAPGQVILTLSAQTAQALKK